MQRVVILFPGALGDLVLALPALRLVRERHAAAHVTLAVTGHLVALATVFAVADRVTRLDGADLADLFTDGPLPPWLADRPLLYSWFGASDPVARQRLTAVTQVSVLERVERGEAAIHAAADYVAKLGGVAPSSEVLALGTRVAFEASDTAGWGEGSGAGPWLAVHAGAGAPAKCWPTAQVSRVVAWWRRRGGRVLEVRGPAELDLPRLEADRRTDGAALVDVARELAAVDLYLGNDSGISHLAGAAGARGVVVFGPTLPERWRPLGGALRPVAASVRADFPGAPVDLDRVIDTLAEVLNLDKPADGI